MEFKKLLSYVIAIGVVTSSIQVTAANSDQYGFNQGNGHPDGFEGSVDYTEDRPYFTINLYDQYVGYGVNQSSNALVVSAVASHDVSYQWLADGVPIEGAKSYMFYPATADEDIITYTCMATNVITGHTTTSSATTVVVSYEYGYAEIPLITEQYASTITYEQFSAASPLVISVDPRINGSLKYTWYCIDTQTGLTTELTTGYANQMSSIYLSTTPNTSATGTYLYYCDVINEYNYRQTSARSEIAKVIITNTYNPTANYTVVGSDGTVLLNPYPSVTLDYTGLDNYVKKGGEVVYVTGEHIQSLRVPAISYSYPYTVEIHDIGTGLNYAWKIRYGNTVASNLDLALNLTSSLNNVDKGTTNLDFVSTSSQVIQFKHEGSLNSDGSTMTLYLPTSVSDGYCWLYKLSGNQMLLNTEVQGSITNGLLTANLSSCSNWVISKDRLISVTSMPTGTTSTTTAVTSIPTDSRVYIPQFQNVVSGTVLNLSNINLTNSIANYRFEGWFYDTAYTMPVIGTDLSALTITGNIIANGLYPKFTYYNTSTPDVNYPVPSTSSNLLMRLF